MFEFGVMVLDGWLILFKEDYDEFIDQYCQVQKNWLCIQWCKSESFEEKIRNFKIVSDELFQGFLNIFSDIKFMRRNVNIFVNFL